jgi:regulator of sirC expression with transglutaminase-like and TPR domain
VNSDVHADQSSASTLDRVESSDAERLHLLEEFEKVLGAGMDIPLDEAMLIISATISGGLDVVEYLVRIDELASQVASPTIEGIARHLFAGEGGFRGNEADYYDPANSFLDHVIERRLGIPISLSVLMIAVGRRLGVPLCGVGMPGHFLVGSNAPVGKVPSMFIDPFHFGATLDVDDCRSLFVSVTGNTTGFDERFLACLHPMAVLERVTNNLKSIYLAAARPDALRWVMALRSRMPGIGKTERDEFLRLMAPLN